MQVQATPVIVALLMLLVVDPLAGGHVGLLSVVRGGVGPGGFVRFKY